MKITEQDIATVEQMHDTLLDKGLVMTNSERSLSARRLIIKMYKSHNIQQKEIDINNLIEKSKILEQKHGLKITLTFE